MKTHSQLFSYGITVLNQPVFASINAIITFVIKNSGLSQYLQLLPNMTTLTAMNFNGYILNHILIEKVITRFPTLSYLAFNMHSIITAGDDIDACMKFALRRKIQLYGFYTPKLIELLSCKSFMEAKDLSFIRMVSVGGAMLSSVMYERVESEFRQKMSPSSILMIRM